MSPHQEFVDVFSGIWYFKSTFSLQVKNDRKPPKDYQGAQHLYYRTLQEENGKIKTAMNNNTSSNK